MNKIKGSLPIKIMIHIILFLAGLIVFIGTYNILKYLDSYSVNTRSFLETSEFQSKYLKYVERVAVYVDFKERGYTGNIIRSNNLDIKALFEKEVNKPNKAEDASDQEDFDYYNTILNNANTNFKYYVINLTTGDQYHSPDLPTIDESNKEDSFTSVDKYLKHIKRNSAYLIINTDTDRYTTNVNRKDKYINAENLQWVIDYITGKYSDSSGDNRDDYIICVSIDEGFPNVNDEFGTMNYHFQSLYKPYSAALTTVPVAFFFLLIFLGIAIATSGYKKGVHGIYLNRFDKLYTEVGFLIMAGTLIALLEFSLYLKDFITETLKFATSYGLVVFFIFIYPFAMLGLLSVVKRVKANVLLDNSIIGINSKKFHVFIIEFMKHKALTYQAAMLLIVFITIQTIDFFVFYHPHKLVYLTIFYILLICDYIFLMKSLLKVAIDFNILTEETKKLTEGDFSRKVPVNDLSAPAQTLGNYVNNIGDGLSAAVEEKLKSERLKTELITNVSHDIKTPLTSIINYIDLLRKEKLNNEKAAGYLEVLSTKSWRLKNLIEDLVEVSKASSGNITLHLESLNIVELIKQAIGEFEDRFMIRKLDVILSISKEPIYIMADGRSTYRIIENLFSNANKYALEGTRIYVDIIADDTSVSVSVKNISTNKLNISSDELMERFVRGDLSRNTEGSGLGLSIARSLASLQNAVFDIILDGDLFKAVVKFKILEESDKEEI